MDEPCSARDTISTLAIEDLDHKITEVIDMVVPHEEEVRDRNGRWYRLQIRPYTTVDKKIDGAVISVVDIDALKRALGAAEWARDFAKATVEAVQTPLVVLDARREIVSANEAFRDLFNARGTALEGRNLFAVQSGVLTVPELKSALDRVFEANERFEALELERELPHLGRRALSASGGAVLAPCICSVSDAGRIVTKRN